MRSLSVRCSLVVNDTVRMDDAIHHVDNHHRYLLLSILSSLEILLILRRSFIPNLTHLVNTIHVSHRERRFQIEAKWIEKFQPVKHVRHFVIRPSAILSNPSGIVVITLVSFVRFGSKKSIGQVRTFQEKWIDSKNLWRRIRRESKSSVYTTYA